MVFFTRNCWFCTFKVEDIIQKKIVAPAVCSVLACGLQATTSPNAGLTQPLTLSGQDLTSTVRLVDHLRLGVDTDYGHKQVVWHEDGSYDILRTNGDITDSFSGRSQRIVALLNRLVGVSGGNLNPDDYQRIMSEIGQILSTSSGEENVQAGLLDSMVRASGQSATLGQPINLPQEDVQSTFPMAMPQQQPAVETPVAPSSTETTTLAQRNEELTNENADLKSQVEAQQAEIEQLKAELAKLKQENK